MIALVALAVAGCALLFARVDHWIEAKERQAFRLAQLRARRMALQSRAILHRTCAPVQPTPEIEPESLTRQRDTAGMTFSEGEE